MHSSRLTPHASRLTPHLPGIVGGKNASLGEMITNLISKGVAVPPGFATTAQAFREFLSANKLDERINSTLSALDVTDSAALRATGERIRGWVLDATLPSQLCEQVLSAYHTLCEQDAEKARQAGNSVAASEPMTVAVRSSATAEDLPGASFGASPRSQRRKPRRDEDVLGLDAARLILPSMRPRSRPAGDLSERHGRREPPVRIPQPIGTHILALRTHSLHPASTGAR